MACHGMMARMAEIGHVLVHPPFARRFTVLEHPAGELEYLGDALGADCTVVDFVGGWVMPFRTDGSTNEDWFGWREELLSPFAGTVVAVRASRCLDHLQRI